MVLFQLVRSQTWSAGQYLDAGLVCQDCDLGIYNSLNFLGNYWPGDDTMQLWPDGQISNKTAKKSWILWDNGEKSSADHQSWEICPANTYSYPATAVCTPCPTDETSDPGSKKCKGVWGDGFRTASEECDDGRTDNNDGWDK